MATVKTQKLPLGVLLRRALSRRCPVCGGGKIFESWYRLKTNCPTCGYRFERESGYWVSAIIVNTAATFALFGIFFVGVMLLTFPDVSWGPVLLVAAVTNVLFPTFFFPMSKTLLMAIDLWTHPLPPEVATKTRI
ncbi:MAG TPA: DUF983 domain-containing protein [Actinomycetota bacterium]|nr:DUF983 domain-containing protein [Actinomycetota bacterium]